MKYIFGILVLMISLSSCTIQRDKQVDTAFLKWSYKNDFHELDLAGKNLTQVPDFEKYLTWSYQYDIWSIRLDNNRIQYIHPKAFEFFPNLKEINLSYNKIKNIQLHTLPIEKLLIHKNNIKKVDISWLKKLKHLNLWYNHIQSGKHLKLPNSLQHLELQHNQLKDLTSISALTNLQKLKLEFNQLVDKNMVPLKHLNKLRFISVGQNQLSQNLEQWFVKFNKAMNNKK